jgi:hypothetical protein
MLSEAGHQKAGQPSNDGVLRDGSQDIHGEEEDVLQQNRSLRESPSSAVSLLMIAAASGTVGSLDARPGDVNVEQDEQRSQSQDAWIKLVVCPAKSIEE